MLELVDSFPIYVLMRVGVMLCDISRRCKMNVGCDIDLSYDLSALLYTDLDSGAKMKYGRKQGLRVTSWPDGYRIITISDKDIDKNHILLECQRNGDRFEAVGGELKSELSKKVSGIY